jgi:hypothetical protein
MTLNHLTVFLQGLADLLNPRSTIGIKRMGELDEKVFFNACKERYGAEAETKALEFCSLWQDNLRYANWHPFKMVPTGDTHKVRPPLLQLLLISKYIMQC